MVVFSLRRLRPDYSDGEETGSGPQSSGHGGFNNTMFHGTAMAVLKGRAVAPELWLVCFGYVSANPTLAERRLLPQVVAAETFRNSRANSSLPLFRVMRRTLRAYGDWLRKELGGAPARPLHVTAARVSPCALPSLRETGMPSTGRISFSQMSRRDLVLLSHITRHIWQNENGPNPEPFSRNGT
jgi:hypothetical protein